MTLSQRQWKRKAVYCVCFLGVSQLCLQGVAEMWLFHWQVDVEGYTTESNSFGPVIVAVSSIYFEKRAVVACLACKWVNRWNSQADPCAPCNFPYRGQTIKCHSIKALGRSRKPSSHNSSLSRRFKNYSNEKLNKLWQCYLIPMEELGNNECRFRTFRLILPFVNRN